MENYSQNQITESQASKDFQFFINANPYDLAGVDIDLNDFEDLLTVSFL